MRKIIVTGVGLVVLLSSTFTLANDPYETIIADQQNGRYQQALTQVDKLLGQNANDVQALLLKGNVHRMMGNVDQASYIFKQIIQQFPKMPEAYNNLAVLYAGQGQTALAIETLQQAFATSESYSTAYQNLRTLYSEMASTAYRDALNIEKPQQKKNHFTLTSITQVESHLMPVAVEQTGADDVDKAANTMLDSAETVAKSIQQNEQKSEQENIQQSITQLVGLWSKAWSGKIPMVILVFIILILFLPKG